MPTFYGIDGQFWRRFRWPALVLIGLAAMAAGLWLYQSVLAPARASAAALATLQSRSFSDLAGSDRTLLDWQGKVRVLNFWATWCEPCREEIPALHEVHPRDLFVPGRAWRTFLLKIWGHEVTANTQAVPDTMAAINKIPGVHTALFSILAGGAEIDRKSTRLTPVTSLSRMPSSA